MAGRRRGGTIRDMVLSLGICLLIVGGAVAVKEQRPAATVTVVDYTDVVPRAQQAASYPVLRPVGLPSGWRATSARVSTPAAAGDPVRFVIGFLTPTDQYASVVQDDHARDDVLRAELELTGDPARRRTGPVVVGGVSWEGYRSGHRSELALVRSSGPATVVVTGSAPLAELRVLAAALAAAG